MPQFYKDRIIRLLKHPDYGALQPARLAKALGVEKDNYPQFKSALDELLAAGHVLAGTGNYVSLPPLPGRIIGKFRANARGFGFVCPLEPNVHGDLFIPPDGTGGAMTGDTVAARVEKKPHRGRTARCTGRVMEILERSSNKFVGTLKKDGANWIVEPDGNSFLNPIAVNDVEAKGAREKDKVVIEILSFPTAERRIARGVITEVLGRSGAYATELAAVTRQFNIPDEFDQKVMAQARGVVSHFDRIKDQDDTGRLNTTTEIIVTIDPPDAKDFDDAISLTRDGDGNRVLGVHIADVSFFVTPDSPLDLEARQRGNSTYLPGKTIPMLPEVLSNGLCSLQPQQRRMCKSAFITYDAEGRRLKAEFANTAIQSTQRLTYLQADSILKGHTAKADCPEVIELLKDAERLARSIEARRRRDGMLHLDLPETELETDQAGMVVDAHPADDSYPHTMIEMFMVEANEAVAGFLDRHKAPFIRRLHPEPDELTMKGLSLFVRALGYSLPNVPDREAIQHLLEAAGKAENALAVNLAVLRSMEKAKYSSLNIGHWALASRHYCHFTSPIRRYADLLVHRILQEILEGRKVPAQDTADLERLGSHISFTEQRSEDAERQLRTVMILQMLSKRVGEVLDCVITGMAGFGVFAQSTRFGVEGLIRTEQLGGAWRFDPRTQTMSESTGRTIRLGQAVKARIAAVTPATRQLDLMPEGAFGHK